MAVIVFLCAGTINSFAQCTNMPKPSVHVAINTGQVTYNNKLNREQFPAKAYAETMGLTVTQLISTMDADTVFKQKGQRGCVALKNVRVEIGFPKIDVYIDKKYKPNSCQYNVIKEHENYHVRVQQEGLKFFSDKIKEAYKVAAEKLDPVSVTSPQEATTAANKMLEQIKKDVTPLITFVEKRLREENAVIDTEEAYRDTSKKCKRW